MLFVAALTLMAPLLRADCSLTTTGTIPLNDLGPGSYHGFTAGLYPAGSDTIPAAHAAAAFTIATDQIKPLNASGNPDPVNGRIVMISIGMSNTTQEFATKGTQNFKLRADADPAKNPQLVIVDGAQGGQDAPAWVDPNATTWSIVNQRLAAAGVAPQQVQVAWLKQALAGPNNYGAFPAHAQALQSDLEIIVRNLKTNFPNIKITYLSPRTRAYTNTPTALNPEPFAYETGFAVKWTVEDQIIGAGNLNFDPANGAVVAPLILWGPYIWADGLTPRSDGFTWLCSDLEADFTHPSASGGVPKVATHLLAFFKTDPTAAPWFLKRTVTGQPPEVTAGASVSSGAPPLSVNFTASATDPDGTIVAYQWTFDDGTFSAAQNPAKTFPASGNYSVHLTVTDNSGNTTLRTLPISVAPAQSSPTPTSTPTPPPPTPTPPTTPTPVPCAVIALNENFDAVTAPALPAGWVSSFSSGPSGCPPKAVCTLGTNWATSTTTPASSPNCAFHNAPSCVTDSTLDTPPFPGYSGSILDFWHSYDLSSGFDGAVLEISIGGGPFIDFVAAGGSFFPGGGYNGTISTGFQNPLAGRAAWTGDSGGYVTTFASMPAAASGGQPVVLRFRIATDCGGFSNGWRLDNIRVAFAIPCNSPTPTIPPPATPTPTATSTPTATPTPTPVSPTPPSASPTQAPGSPTPTSTPTPASPTPIPGSPTPTPTPTATPSSTPAAQAINLSTRMRVQTGDNVGIGGFIITGSAPKHVILRAMTPMYVKFDLLIDPVLELHGPGAFATITNDNWRDDPAQAAAILAAGLEPWHDLESAIDATLDPGPYTAVVRGKNNTSGVGLIEVYDVSQAVPAKLANISTRAFVGTNSNILIAGFILGGNSGEDRIVVRGIGPSLTALGVPNALANPRLELRGNNGALLLANDDWQENSAQAAELTAAGLAPANPLESGIAVALPPGLYTALLAGANNGTGIGIVEVYDRGP